MTVDLSPIDENLLAEIANMHGMPKPPENATARQPEHALRNSFLHRKQKAGRQLLTIAAVPGAHTTFITFRSEASRKSDVRFAIRFV